MKTHYIVFTIIVMSGLLSALPMYARAQQGGVTTVSVESRVEPRPSGKSISVKSYCPEGKTLIGGGGECYGYLNTEHKVVLTLSAPSPEDSAWMVECSNMDKNPGDVQARAWAVCADTELFEPEKKK